MKKTGRGSLADGQGKRPSAGRRPPALRQRRPPPPPAKGELAGVFLNPGRTQGTTATGPRWLTSRLTAHTSSSRPGCPAWHRGAGAACGLTLGQGHDDPVCHLVGDLAEMLERAQKGILQGPPPKPCRRRPPLRCGSGMGPGLDLVHDLPRQRARAHNEHAVGEGASPHDEIAYRTNGQQQRDDDKHAGEQGPFPPECPELWREAGQHQQGHAQALSKRVANYRKPARS